MCQTLQVRWTITPELAPQPWIACSGCGGLRAFQSSDKIRLNANGRKLDAWLIYKCTICEKTWNRPIFERQNVRNISPIVLEALQSNDPDWIRGETFNLEALRRKAQRINEFPECKIVKELLCETPDWTRLEIELVARFPTSTRLDRLLATELNVSRPQLIDLHERALLRIEPDRTDILRRRIKNGLKVTIDLSGYADRELWKPPAIGK
ncbi:DUF1062 domain-containing protein [Microvirga terricola]|uniref:DUF1062 domain-containing protein n=1 Tax=Microvirga terricola TaxID=2719797 RepID=A0ABX0VCI5_9HYPH|nr:DUF1062 domain-containing protein [Microvirga terricola]NIX76670.1 DUF1062 domain-containing protein [Microvirga terricola]